MDFSKKDWWFLIKSVLFAAGLPVAAIAVWALCVDWRGPADELPAADRDAMESCALDQRELGTGFLHARPDCRRFLPPQPLAAAKATAR